MSITTEPLTNTDLATRAAAKLQDAGFKPRDAQRITDLMPPAGHHELVKALDEIPDALLKMRNMPWTDFAARFRTTETDAISIQVEIAAGIR